MTVTASTVDTLGQYAAQVLAVAEDALSTTNAGVPDRTFLTAWPPAFDCCPFLAVATLPLREAPTSPLAPPEEQALRTRFGNVILAQYTIWAVRCAAQTPPGGDFPRTQDITEVALTVLQDGWALWNGIRHAHEDGDLFDGCLGVHFDGAVSIPEQGGCVGVQMQIRASIPGIPNT